ncbi:leucine-rich repeat domain-containing protein, partial [Listeria monocytogenes]|nr:leucine-rich repeat domain-containing protein [Listeria monocytogenes]
GEGSFYNTGLESIAIPNSVKIIRKAAFQQNLKLETVTFEQDSQLETIEERGFKNCEKLTQITLPDSLVTTERKVFEGCLVMQSISIGAKLRTLG